MPMQFWASCWKYTSLLKKLTHKSRNSDDRLPFSPANPSRWSMSEIAWLHQLSVHGKRPGRTFSNYWQLLQLRVLSLSLDKDGDVGVGVFPEGEEILIGGAGL